MLFTFNDINLKLRKQIVKLYVWSEFLYGSESWMIGVAERRRIKAFGLWCYKHDENILIKQNQ